MSDGVALKFAEEAERAAVIRWWQNTLRLYANARRGARGEANKSAKLTAEQVLAIRGEVGTLQQIAERYGVSVFCVHAIKRRKRWRHL